MQAIYELTRDNVNEIYINCGKNTCPPHFHQQPELVFVEEGELTITINNKTQVLIQNQFAIADSFDIHSYHGSKDYRSSVFIIPHRYLGDYNNYKRNRVLTANFLTEEKACIKIKSAMEELKSHLKYNELIVGGLVNALLGQILESISLSNSSENSDLELMRKLLVHIENNYRKDLSLNMLSSTFGYSKYYFSRIINKYLCCSLSEYINNLRLKKAIALMREQPDLKPQDAALSSGFNSVQTFYRCFKDIYHSTPGEYLQSLSAK